MNYIIDTNTYNQLKLVRDYIIENRVMKELSVEEKAKAYDEALKRAKKLYEQGTITESLSYVFPELRESEDERIRKALICHISKISTEIPVGALHRINGVDIPDILAWLEKQKTSEEAMQYLKENHSPSEVSDFQTAMNIAVAKAYDKGVKDGLENKGQTFTKKDVDDAYLAGVHDAKKRYKPNPYNGVGFEYNGNRWSMCARDNGVDVILNRDRIKHVSIEKQGNPTDINPSEFDLRLNRLLKQFETLPKEELASSLSFYLNVVQNDGTYREEKQGQVNETIISQHEDKICKENNDSLTSEDEKIRSMLIKFFSNGAFYDSSTNGIPDKDIVAWLEKQGKIVAYYEDRLDECSCKYFNKGYKHALEKQGEQTPAWSEEDKVMLDKVIKRLRKHSVVDEEYLDIYYWLKSLKQRIGG